VVVLGVGSDLRGDDGAGPLLVQKLRRKRRLGRIVAVLDGATAPENLFGEVRRLRPSHVIMVDVARFGGETGEIRLLTAEEAGGITFCTHALPVGLLAQYLERETGADVLILGIQPQDASFGAQMSVEVVRAEEGIVGVVRGAVGRPSATRS